MQDILSEISDYFKIILFSSKCSYVYQNNAFPDFALNGYCRCIKFRWLIFCAFNWQENSWGINFCGHDSIVGIP